MKVGTKSVLFGYHQFILHPLMVAWAWWKLFGFPRQVQLWVAFFVHDIGLWGKPNMDGPEGEQHPELGARIMECLFDRDDNWQEFCDEPAEGDFAEINWYWFTKYHSRHLAKRKGAEFSPLCVADKLAIALYPKWLFILLVRLTGEADEYMMHPVAPGYPTPETVAEWVDQVQQAMVEWTGRYKSGGFDDGYGIHAHDHSGYL